MTATIRPTYPSQGVNQFAVELNVCRSGIRQSAMENQVIIERLRVRPAEMQAAICAKLPVMHGHRGEIRRYRRRRGIKTGTHRLQILRRRFNCGTGAKIQRRFGGDGDDQAPAGFSCGHPFGMEPALSAGTQGCGK